MFSLGTGVACAVDGVLCYAHLFYSCGYHPPCLCITVYNSGDTVDKLLLSDCFLWITICSVAVVTAFSISVSKIVDIHVDNYYRGFSWSVGNLLNSAGSRGVAGVTWPI